MKSVRFFSPRQERMLSRNGQPGNHGKNHVPVAEAKVGKLGYRFLITERHPEFPDMFFGLFDFDTDIHIGYYSLNVIQRKAEQAGGELTIIPDEEQFNYNLAVYAMAADKIGALITENGSELTNKIINECNKGKNKNPAADITKLEKKLVWS